MRKNIEQIYENSNYVILCGSCWIFKKRKDKRGTILWQEWIYNSSFIWELESKDLMISEFKKARREQLRKVILDSEIKEIQKDFYIESGKIISKRKDKVFIMGE